MIYAMTLGELYTKTAHTFPSWYKGYIGHPEFPDTTENMLGKTYNLGQVFADLVKESEDDSFVFMITMVQVICFDEMLRRLKLEEYEVFRSKPITNGVHVNNGRNVVLVVLASKTHAWREMFD